jgi:hypothetical protein
VGGGGTGGGGGGYTMYTIFSHILPIHFAGGGRGGIEEDCV